MKTQNTEKKNFVEEKEVAPPAIEAIKQDAKIAPEKYINEYKIPAEGE